MSTWLPWLERLVGAEALESCAAELSALFTEFLGRPPVAHGPHLLWSSGTPRVLLLGHYDTVWPIGTVARWPFAVEGDHATGPGVFDMKAGIVQMVLAMASLPSLEGVAALLTSDEETGSLTSRDLIESTAAGCAACFVLEPSAGGKLKSARKGTGMYTVSVSGKASHAGLEPEKGVNALVGLASVVLEIAAFELGDGTTVTPTVSSAGTATNVVPAAASAEIDVRVWSASEGERVDELLRALSPTVGSLAVTGGMNRPPMEPSPALVEVARAKGFESVPVGGGSDGNFTAAMGIPTLDGLGAVGDHAHGEGEYCVLSAVEERASLVAQLVTEVMASTPPVVPT